MLESIALAGNIMQDCQIPGTFSLNNRDSVLLQAFIADRIIKTRLYDLEWLAHSPEYIMKKKQRLKEDLKRVNLEASLTRLALGREEVLQDYTDKRNRLRARNLELAANDLVARASAFTAENHNPRTEIIVNDALLESWTTRWANVLHTKTGHARQKFLRYKK